MAIRSVVAGYPSDVILSEAAKNNVNLIIMGTAGLRGISKIKALGSVARRVSEQAVCPVLFGTLNDIDFFLSITLHQMSQREIKENCNNKRM